MSCSTFMSRIRGQVSPWSWVPVIALLLMVAEWATAQTQTQKAATATPSATPSATPTDMPSGAKPAASANAPAAASPSAASPTGTVSGSGPAATPTATAAIPQPLEVTLVSAPAKPAAKPADQKPNVADIVKVDWKITRKITDSVKFDTLLVITYKWDPKHSFTFDVPKQAVVKQGTTSANGELKVSVDLTPVDVNRVTVSIATPSDPKKAKKTKQAKAAPRAKNAPQAKAAPQASDATDVSVTAEIIVKLIDQTDGFSDRFEALNTPEHFWKRVFLVKRIMTRTLPTLSLELNEKVGDDPMRPLYGHTFRTGIKGDSADLEAEDSNAKYSFKIQESPVYFRLDATSQSSSKKRSAKLVNLQSFPIVKGTEFKFLGPRDAIKIAVNLAAKPTDATDATGTKSCGCQAPNEAIVAYGNGDLSFSVQVDKEVPWMPLTFSDGSLTYLKAGKVTVKVDNDSGGDIDVAFYADPPSGVISAKTFTIPKNTKAFSPPTPIFIFESATLKFPASAEPDDQGLNSFAATLTKTAASFDALRTEVWLLQETCVFACFDADVARAVKSKFKGNTLEYFNDLHDRMLPFVRAAGDLTAATKDVADTVNEQIELDRRERRLGAPPVPAGIESRLRGIRRERNDVDKKLATAMTKLRLATDDLIEKLNNPESMATGIAASPQADGAFSDFDAMPSPPRNTREGWVMTKPLWVDIPPKKKPIVKPRDQWNLYRLFSPLFFPYETPAY